MGKYLSRCHLGGYVLQEPGYRSLTELQFEVLSHIGYYRNEGNRRDGYTAYFSFPPRPGWPDDDQEERLDAWRRDEFYGYGRVRDRFSVAMVFEHVPLDGVFGITIMADTREDAMDIFALLCNTEPFKGISLLGLEEPMDKVIIGRGYEPFPEAQGELSEDGAALVNKVRAFAKRNDISSVESAFLAVDLEGMANRNPVFLEHYLKLYQRSLVLSVASFIGNLGIQTVIKTANKVPACDELLFPVYGYAFEIEGVE